MTFLDMIRAPRAAFAAEGEGAGAGAGGDGTGAGAGGGEGAGAGAGGEGAGAGAGAGAGGAAKWWEGSDYSPEERQWLTARGLAEDDAAKVLPKLVKGHRAAEQRLGKGMDTIMDRPAKDQKLTDWMRGQKEVFGLPETEADYQIARPEGMKDGIAWDGEFEAAAKKLAFEQGLLPAQLQAITDLYAGKVGAMAQAADAAYEAANAKLMEGLTRDWGKETPAKLAQARQAAHVLAEKAGLDAAGLEAVSATISQKAGDAATIRMFAALAEMMGDDKMVQGAGGKLGTTPAEARAQLAQMQSPDGAWAKASREGNHAEIARLRPEIERLSKLAAGQ